MQLSLDQERRARKRVADKIRRAGRTEIERVRQNAAMKAWRVANPETVKSYYPKSAIWQAANSLRVREINRNNWLKRNYGISTQEWEALFDAQGRLCASCHRIDSCGLNWHTDHIGDLPCTREQIRGILCAHCNRAAQKGLREDVERLRNLVNYLEKFL